MTALTRPGTRSARSVTCAGIASFGLWLGCCGAGCNSSSKGPAPAKASASATSAASPVPRSPASGARLRPTEHCRAIQVAGKVTKDGGPPLKRGDELDGKHWLTLEDGANVVVRHAQSAREYALSGPGRARPCHAGEEEVLLARGEFRATTGGGARPGAFVTLATPWGTLRYGNADASIRATSQAAEVSVNTGTLWVDAAHGAKLTGKPQLTGPKAKSQLQATPQHSLEALVGACEADAKAAEDKAESLLRGGNQPGLGANAAHHMRLRGAARRSCLVAQAALGLAVEPAVALALEKRLNDAHRRWQRVPLHLSQKRQQK